MQKMKSEYPIAAMAEALEVSKSGFFAHRRKGARAATPAGSAALVADIGPIFAEHWRSYGSPRMVKALHERGHRGGKNPVARLMREAGLAPQAAASPLASSNHGRQPPPTCGREPALEDAHAGPPEPSVGGRHHLYRHGRGLAISGRPAGCLFTPLCGLADGRVARCRAGDPSVAESLARPATGIRLAPPLGPGRAVRQWGHDCAAGRQWDGGIHEPQGQLLRQRQDGALLGHAQNLTKTTKASSTLSKKDQAVATTIAAVAVAI